MSSGSPFGGAGDGGSGGGGRGQHRRCVQALVDIAEELGVEHLTHGPGDRAGLRVGEGERRVQEGRVARRVHVRRVELQPHLPQPVDVGVVQPEQRVQTGRVERAHPARVDDVAGIVVVVADQRVHCTVRHVLQRSPLASVEAEVGAFAATERRLTTRCRVAVQRQSGDHRLPHLDGVDVAVEREAGPRGLRALAGLEVVVVQRHVEERRRHGRLAGVIGIDGVPVRQRPGLVLQRVPDDALERREVHPVPRQEVPASVLTVAPQVVAGVRAAGGGREAVDGCLEPPPQWVGRLASRRIEVSHPADGQLVGLEYVGPVALRVRPVPDICTGPSHGSTSCSGDESCGSVWCAGD